MMIVLLANPVTTKPAQICSDGSGLLLCLQIEPPQSCGPVAAAQLMSASHN